MCLLVHVEALDLERGTRPHFGHGQAPCGPEFGEAWGLHTKEHDLSTFMWHPSDWQEREGVGDTRGWRGAIPIPPGGTCPGAPHCRQHSGLQWPVQIRLWVRGCCFAWGTGASAPLATPGQLGMEGQAQKPCLSSHCPLGGGVVGARREAGLWWGTGLLHANAPALVRAWEWTLLGTPVG